jgi:hypothetical protein
MSTMTYLRRGLGLTLVATAVVVSLVAVPTPSQATFQNGRTAMGISDSDPSTFKTDFWPQLNVRRARVVVDWDIAEAPAGDILDKNSRLYFEDWLHWAGIRGVEPFVVFAPSPRYRRVVNGQVHPGFRVPTEAELRRAFRRFRVSYPQVRLFGAWNEPNFGPSDVYDQRWTEDGSTRLDNPSCPVQETLRNCGPLAAAFMWRVLRQEVTPTAEDPDGPGGVACGTDPPCVIVAGEFDGTPNDRAYWGAYKTFLRDHRPQVWGIHPWTDANRFQQHGHHCQEGDDKCTTRTFLQETSEGDWAANGKGHVWLSEVGAYRTKACTSLDADFARSAAQCDYNPNSPKVYVFSQENQAATADFITRLPNISDRDRVTRIYYYNFQGQCQTPAGCPQNDSALMSDYDNYPAQPQHGSPRSAFCVIRDRGLQQPPYPTWPC